MTRIVPLAPGDDRRPVHAGVRDLLREVDDEFVPPLSQRVDTLVLHPAGTTPVNGLVRYLDAMRCELWLVALDEDGGVVGLLSYLTDHEDPQLEDFSPSLYATTVAVSARVRRAGIGERLYDAFEAVARRHAVPYLTTRTWPTNTAHLRLLGERGFRQVAQVPDDRDGVGTVYLAYSVDAGRTARVTTRR